MLEKIPDINNKTVLQELKKNIFTLLNKNSARILLFGSMARGDYHSGSDIDIAIIVPELTRQLKKQILEKVAEIEFRYFVPLSTIIFSEKQFNDLKKRERRLALDIEHEGIPL